jgi:hypothetical protein
MPSRNSFEISLEGGSRKTIYVCVASIAAWGCTTYGFRRRAKRVITCLGRARATPYSLIPKLSICVAACSANFSTFPEYVWQLGVLVPRTHPL